MRDMEQETGTNIQGGYALKLMGLLVVCCVVYYGLLTLLGMVNQSVPQLRAVIDMPFDDQGRPTGLIAYLPILTIGVTGLCMVVELILGGWSGSTFREVLTNRSASVRMDLFYFLLRVSGITALAAIVVSFGTMYAVITWIGKSLSFHLLDRIGFWPLETVLLIVVNSLAFYCFHWTMHTKWFWEIHKVHHSAEVYNVLLPYRNHPVDFWLAAVAFALFGAVAGGSPEAVAGWLVFNSIYQSMVHSNVQWPRWADAIFITPATHRIHHSNSPEHWDTNFGVLCIWDRLFGTYYPPGPVVEVGVDDRQNYNHDRFGAELFLVIGRWLGSVKTALAGR